jgi:hypothetical protein
LDDLSHASASPAPKLEKKSDVATLIDMPDAATIIRLSVPEETSALSSAEAERDVSSAEPAKENKSGTNDPALKMLTGELACRPRPRCDIQVLRIKTH